MQQKLNDLGYWNGEADGTYGELTSQAVMAYQKAAGIAADGVAGPDTQRAMAKGIRPAVRTTSGDAIEVDLQAQLVKVVLDGRLKYVFNTSTGSGETYLQKGESEPQVATTPTGKFVIERSINGMRVAKLGKLWRPRYFYEGYALHGASYVPNYPASHGCVRLANQVIDFVWAQDLAPIGRTVWVY
ncbi:L,D-transpeptidase family protein [Nakamurella lactea]|uniref:L,D-transpeptidase family protein n=1 Tax=Nakamurella lactea TaxID=459515 RepID=UPI00041EA249|nr:L,D-transpeptidase family protein [Nakamurella lactea]